MHAKVVPCSRVCNTSASSYTGTGGNKKNSSPLNKNWCGGGMLVMYHKFLSLQITTLHTKNEHPRLSRSLKKVTTEEEEEK